MQIQQLPPREREIVDVLLANGPATAREIGEQLEDPPTNSAVRTMLRRLERKGVLTHEERGVSYVYRVAAKREIIERSALRRLVDTYFGGSPSRTVAALLDSDLFDYSAADVARLRELVDGTRSGGE